MPPATSQPLSGYQVRVTDHDQDGQPIGNHHWQADRVPEFHRCQNDECKASRDDKSPYQHPLGSLVSTMIARNETERRVSCGGGIYWPPKRSGITVSPKRCLCHITIQLMVPATSPATA